MIDLSPAFFDLQLCFAKHIVRVSHISYEDAVLNYTNIYLRCLDRSFDHAHPAWQAYLEGLHQAPEPALWTYTFYKCRGTVDFVSPYGCFRYDYLEDERAIRLHFTNVDNSGPAPLSKERMPVRLRELQTLFAEIKRQHVDALVVRGVSWLYNIDAYKRLFPPKYTNVMKMVDEEFQYLALWGQFLQRDGQVRQSLANTFLSCCCEQDSLEGLMRCFPYQVQGPVCSIASFYELYEDLGDF